MATETIPLRPESKIEEEVAAEAAGELSALADMLLTASTGEFQLRDDTLNSYTLMLDSRADVVRKYFQWTGE